MANQVAQGKAGQQRKATHSRNSLGPDGHKLASSRGAGTAPGRCCTDEEWHYGRSYVNEDNHYGRCLSTRMAVMKGIDMGGVKSTRMDVLGVQPSWINGINKDTSECPVQWASNICGMNGICYQMT